MRPSNIPQTPGSYVLVLRNPKPRVLKVGRLGSLAFPPGTYAYVGSAMGGLARRVRRYLKPIERPHWHIDALLPAFQPAALWLFPSPVRRECDVARLLARIPSITAVEGFGSTDCACPSHLFIITGIEKAPLFETLKGALSCPEALEICYS